ncbi:MAG: phosphatase PAP2 family protein [Rikenellaceae bacterium]|jgi:undecaprenyl-diphosphatase|nr:phosphatase PAP2 family protein [Bacteroidales bacterium]
MFEKLIDLDKSLFLILNHATNPFLDKVMVLASEKYTWLPLYIVIAFFIFFKIENGGTIRLRPFKPAFLILAGAFLTFALTDIISASVIKDLVQRLRPGHDPEIGELARLLDGKGGMYGFVSSHAANVFGLATFTTLCFKKKWYAFFIFFWAILVSYSRIYVGRHFPLDVICGAMLGFLTGWIIYKFKNLIAERINNSHTANN